MAAAGLQSLIPGAGRRRLMLIWAALLALCSQSIVTQSHVHLAPPAPAAATADGAQAAPRASKPGPAPELPATCPICREIAHAGAYLAPGPVALAAPVALLGMLPPAPATPWTGRTRSHAWRSRGPPHA